jgi:hypothetical protein
LTCRNRSQDQADFIPGDGAHQGLVSFGPRI